MICVVQHNMKTCIIPTGVVWLVYRCLVIFIPRNIWEEQLICLRGWNFSYHKSYRFKPKLILQVEKAIDASFRLYGEWKILKGISVESMECLNKDAYKKERKTMLSVHPWVGTIKSLPVPNYLIYTTDKSYGFSGDLTETIN